VLALLALSTFVSAEPRGGSLLAPRRPVAPPIVAAGRPSDASRARDPVVARIHSLLAGPAVRNAGIDVVPLYARTPSEASVDDDAFPEWPGSRLRLRRAVAGIARARNAGARPVLLIPGLFVRADAEEFQILQVDTIPKGGSLHAPVREERVQRVRPNDALVGLLAPTAAARVVLGETQGHSVGAEAARGTKAHAAYVQLARDSARWFPRSDRLASKQDRAGTAVGCVILVGGNVLSAHVFASHALFRDAWADILTTAVIEQRSAVRAGMPRPILVQRAERGNPRGRALLALRTLTAEAGRLREIPGGGLRWVAGGRDAGFLAQGLVAASGRVVYAGMVWAPPLAATTAKGAKKPGAPQADPEEDPTRRRGGRYNPFGGRKPGSLPGVGRDPTVPPR